MKWSIIKRFLLLGIFLWLFFFLKTPVYANAPDVTGQVLSSFSYAPISNVTVQWTDSTGRQRTVTTDTNGYFYFPSWQNLGNGDGFGCLENTHNIKVVNYPDPCTGINFNLDNVGSLVNVGNIICTHITPTSTPTPVPPTPTSTPTPAPSTLSWIISSNTVCQNDIQPPLLTRSFAILWPPVPPTPAWGPLDTRYDPVQSDPDNNPQWSSGGIHIQTITSSSAYNGMYFGLQTNVKDPATNDFLAFQPISASPSSSIFTLAKYFNPQTWMVHWDRSLPSGKYTINFNIPPQLCTSAPTGTLTPILIPSPSPTATPAPTDTPVPTPIPTDTPIPTPTLPSTVTITPSPTATPTLNNLLSPTPSPTLSSILPSPTGTYSGCTLTIGYWKTHPEAWPVSSITLGGITYTKDQAIAILQTPPGGDATYILAQQLIGAKLNVLEGTGNDYINSIISQADNWLILNPLGSNPQGDFRARGIYLAGILDNYNNGLLGAPHCADNATVSPVATSAAIVRPASPLLLPARIGRIIFDNILRFFFRRQ